MSEFTPWPHQLVGVEETLAAIRNGTKSVCLTCPTGGGKTWMTAEIIRRLVQEDGKRVNLYSNRKILTGQMVEGADGRGGSLVRWLEKHGVDFGVKARDWEAYENPDAPVQICSIQTQHAQVIRARKKQMDEHIRLPRADVVFRDECHLRDHEAVLREHADEGSQLGGITATPLDINDLYEKLVVAGKKREMFKYDPPALMPAHISCIEEPDMKKVKRRQDGEYVVNRQIRKLWTSHIVGSTLENWKTLGNDMPTLGFAYGVPEARHHTDVFNKAGIPAATIDGESVYIDGEMYKSSPEMREETFRRLENGNLKVLWCRFVLREGIDLPWVGRLILGCPIGSLLSYIQVVGRLLRYHPDVPDLRIIDHGGNWYRHPSPNDDIDWHAAWEIPNHHLSGAREMGIKDGSVNPGWPCPKCGEGHKRIPEQCRNCGHVVGIKKIIRRVREESGNLREVHGFPQKHKPKLVQGTVELWKRIFWGARKNKPHRTFGQCWAWFCKQHWEKYRCQPPRNLPLMPKAHLDWFSAVGDVPFERLIKDDR